MPFAFLAPLFLFALAAIVIPIVVHLREKQRKNVVEFPSLMFLHQIPFRSVQKRKIRHWALLSIRAIAIALLVAAFSRPFFANETQATGGRLGPKETVIVVDRSYSMSYGDRWKRTQALVAQVVAEIDSADRVSLVFFDRGAEATVRSSSDPGRVTSAIDTASVSSAVTRYGPGLKLAQTILEESEMPNLEAVLISDFQRAGWTGDEGVSFPPGTEIRSLSVAGSPENPGDFSTDNVAVTSVQLRREFFSGRERMTATARVIRSGGDKPLEMPITLELDGQELQTESITLDGTGAASVTFEPFTLATNFTRGRVHVGSDALDADNEVHFVLSPGRALSALVLNGRSARAEQSLYFERALGISDDASFRVATRASSTVTEEDLTTHSLIVLNDARFPTGTSGDRLRRFVEDGGGLLVTLGDRARWTDALADLLPGRFGPATDSGRGGSGRLGFLDYSHPVFEIFAGPRSGDFSRSRFFRSRPLTMFEGGRVLARFDDGSVALAERQVAEGRVLVWTSTLDAFWNDLALQPVFLPFVHQMARHLGGHRERVPWFTSGQVLDLADSDVLASAGMRRGESIPADEPRVAIAPSGGSVSLPAVEGPRYLEMKESGFYEIRPPGTDELHPFTIAVNVDVAESDLATMDPAEVAASVAARDGGIRSGSFDSMNSEARAQIQERRQGLWRFMLVGALLLLVAETVVSNVLSRNVAIRSP
jgi:Aerotolerance regulator N-terminal/von Willebrand factor type A domain